MLSVKNKHIWEHFGCKWYGCYCSMKYNSIAFHIYPFYFCSIRYLLKWLSHTYLFTHMWTRFVLCWAFDIFHYRKLKFSISTETSIAGVQRRSDNSLSSAQTHNESAHSCQSSLPSVARDKLFLFADFHCISIQLWLLEQWNILCEKQSSKTWKLLSKGLSVNEFDRETDLST